jgi:general stress protein 26
MVRRMKTITAEHGPEAVAKLRELVKDVQFAMMTTVTPDGALRSRPMATLQVDDDGQLWFFTADDSGKSTDIAEEHAVNISYAEPKDQRYISVSGNATVERSPEKARELWKPVYKAYFPQGLDDPHLALLRVRVESAEYWDSPTSKAVQLFEMTRAALTGTTPRLGDHAKLDIRSARATG